MLKLRLIFSICVLIFALSCHFPSDAQDSSVSLLYCDDDIRNFSLVSGMDSTLLPGIERPNRLDYHVKEKVFFWIDLNRKINKAPLWQEGAHPTVLIRDVSSRSIAVDWIHNLIYWTNTKRIDLARLDGSMVKTVLKGDLPWSLVLNPAEGFMIWSDAGKIGKIERCDMDGLNRKIIVNEDIDFVTSLAIDLGSRKIFWVDYTKYYLSSAEFDGSHRRNLITKLKKPCDIDVFGQHVYFVTSQSQHEAVYKASKVDGSGLTKLFDGKETLRSVRVFDPSKQLEGYNVCGDNNGGCSHHCLPKPGRSFSCACPNDRNMSSDIFTCLNSDGSAVTPSLTTNAPSSQLTFTVLQTNFTSSTDSAVTTPKLNTYGPSTQLPFTVSQTIFTSSTEENKNVDSIVGSSFTHGTLALVMASLTLIAMVGMMIYNRHFLMKTFANSGITNPVQRRNCEENLYMEAPL